MKMLVTGASGYIGMRLIKLALKQGEQVIAASRRPLTGVDWIPFDLNDLAEIKLPEALDVVIHLAADTKSGGSPQEVTTAKLLIAAAHKVGAKFIFVSSQTAREDAPTQYGRIKWLIEQEVLAAKGIVIRPGQVYGAMESGLFGSLVGLVRNTPLLPALIPSPMIQPIHVDDCATGLLKFATLSNISSGVYCLASPEAVSFTYFLVAIGRYWIRRYNLFIPVPTLFLRWMMQCLAVLGGKKSTKLDINRFDSLLNLPLMNTSSDLDLIDLKLRTLKSGLHRSGSDRRRRLIQEGMSLLCYLLKEKPCRTLVCRYVRMVEKIRSGTPLVLSWWLMRFPILLGWLDDRAFTMSEKGKEFAWRLEAAMLLAEASTQGAVRFLGIHQSTQRIKALIYMVLAVGSECLWRVARMLRTKADVT